MIVTVRKSKTIQFKCQLLVPIAKVADHRLCTVYWVERHFREVPLPEGSSAFQGHSQRGGFKPLPYRSLNVCVKHFSDCAGFDPSTFSRHSLCREAVPTCRCREPLEELKLGRIGPPIQYSIIFLRPYRSIS